MPQAWNFADVWESVAQAAPDALAQVHGTRRVTWSQFDACANGIARHLLQSDLRHQDKVALYLYNGPQYLQLAFGCMKAGLVPVNTNYRYQQDELHYLWDNADAVAVIFHGAFTSLVEAVRARCHKVRVWIHVDDGSAPCPAWAVPYAAVAGTLHERVVAPWGRSGDDLILVYTGGTTGRPRGVMWRQHDLYVASNTTGDPPVADLAHVCARIEALHGGGGVSPPVGLPAAPLMHGTAYVFASTILNRGGTVITLPGRQFDVKELLAAIQAQRVTDLCIVGDAFCRPMVDALDAAREHGVDALDAARKHGVDARDAAQGSWDISSLKAVSSSGMMWSAASKDRLLRHAPNALLIDFLNSSEASGMGRSIASKERQGASARFRLGQNAVVIDDEGRPIAPGSDKVGRIAVRGNIPLGYYRDPAKTMATFPVINQERNAVPGDFARIESDGSITLLGRGSVSINTGGEKVFPEEVEECIKLLPEVMDAVVVGVPDARYGETVAAVVEAVPGRTVVAGTVTAHVRSRLARHKAPRHVMVVESVGRGPNGKADYAALKARVADWLREAPPATQHTQGA